MLRPTGAQDAELKAGGWQARRRRPDWTSIVKAAEKLGSEPWSEALTTHGDWVRDAVMYTAVRHLGYRLADVYREIPGLKYPAAAAAEKRFGHAKGVEVARKRFVGALRRALEGRRSTGRLGTRRGAGDWGQQSSSNVEVVT